MSIASFVTHALAWDPAGARLALIDSSGETRIVDARTGAIKTLSRAPVTRVRDPEKQASFLFLAEGLFVVDQMGPVYFAPASSLAWRKLLGAPFGIRAIGAGGGVIGAAFQPSEGGLALLEILKGGQKVTAPLPPGTVRAVRVSSTRIDVAVGEQLVRFRPDGSLIGKVCIPCDFGEVHLVRLDHAGNVLVIHGTREMTVVDRFADLEARPVASASIAMSTIGFAAAAEGTDGLVVAYGVWNETSMRAERVIIERWRGKEIVARHAVVAEAHHLSLSHDGATLHLEKWKTTKTALEFETTVFVSTASPMRSEPLAFVSESHPESPADALKSAEKARQARRDVLAKRTSAPFRDEAGSARTDGRPALSFSKGLSPEDSDWLAWDGLAAYGALTIWGNDPGGGQRFDGFAERLAQTASLAGLRELTLYGNGLTPKGITALTRGPWTGLRFLHIEWEELGVEGLAAITGSFPELECLHLPFTLNGESLEPLSLSPFRERLVELHLDGNDLDAASLAPLLAVPWPKLEALSLGENQTDNPIGDEGALLLSRAELPALRHLDLSACSIGDDGVKALAKAKWKKGLESIVLRGNELSAKGKTAVKRAFGESL